MKTPIIDKAKAEEARLDRRVFTVGTEAYAQFLARLAPAKPNERLRRTMQSASPWE